MTLPQEIIRRKRDGHGLARAEIEAIVRGITEGTLADAQVGAFAMAAWLNGLNAAETVSLTRAMTASGRRLEWAGLGLDGPVLDKHSTGGVGDKVSLILAPLLAACGAYVPMISGRGLGHTGGTLDKLEAIPGYDVGPDLDRFRRVVAGAGAAIIGQTADLAPADRRLYAVRDVTATVESVPLITASILSKKLAAGLDGLVMDVKVGNGAFADSLDMGRELARSIAEVAAGAGLPAVAHLTDMNQVLGTSAGNAVEVAESIDFLTGTARDARLETVTLALGAEILVLGGLAPDETAAREILEAALDSGEAAERFQTMVHALGGPADLLQRPGAHLPRAPVRCPVPAPASGYVSAVETREVGLLVVELGGGRRRPDDVVDPRVGLTDVLPIGAPIAAGEAIAMVHAADQTSAEAAASRFAALVEVADVAPDPTPVLVERIGP